MGAFLTHRVFVDSNVLYSRILRDWLGMLYLAEESSPFIVYWSEDVLADTIHHLRKDHPTWSGSKTAVIRDRIARTFEIGRVVDYSIDGDYAGRDPDDAHVHAAAVACEADILLTCNVADFVPTACGIESLPYEVYSPDEFFMLMDDSFPQIVRSVAFEQVHYMLKRDGEADLPGRLKNAGAPNFADRVRQHLQAYTPPSTHPESFHGAAG